MKRLFLIFTLINCLIAINAAEIVVNTTHGDKKIFEFDKNLSEITLSNLIVESITGLEQFTNLKKLNFHHVNFINADMSFLSKLNNLETLIFNFVSFKNLNFVNHLNNLKALKLGENISIGTDTVDFSKSNLEYLIYSDFQLKTFPFSLILPKSIKFLAIFNISSNILRENWEKDFLVPEVKYYFTSDINWNLNKKGYSNFIMSNDEFEESYLEYF